MTDPFMEQAGLALNPGGRKPDPLTELRNNLVNKGKGHRGGPEQVAFLEAVAENRFLEYLSGQDVVVDFGQLNLAPLNAVLPFRMQETEFTRPPLSTARAIRKCYRALSQQAASSVAVWNVITLHNIHAGKIDSAFLAATGGKQTGRARIQDALNNLQPKNIIGRKRTVSKTETEKLNQAVDDCVRTAFRSMGGLHSIRGHTSVIGNCNLSRVWWMGQLVEDASREPGLLDADAAWEAVNPHWRLIAEYVIRRLTILAKPPLTSGLIAHLIGFPVRTGAELEDLLRRIGQEFSTVDLHAWTATEVRDHLHEVRKSMA